MTVLVKVGMLVLMLMHLGAHVRRRRNAHRPILRRQEPVVQLSPQQIRLISLRHEKVGSEGTRIVAMQCRQTSWHGGRSQLGWRWDRRCKHSVVRMKWTLRQRMRERRLSVMLLLLLLVTIVKR